MKSPETVNEFLDSLPEDLSLDVVAEAVSSTSAVDFIKCYEASRPAKMRK